jgi:DNA replication and repair protein RecF
MALKRIDIRNLRIIETVSLVPGENLNLVAGRNGAGKTSLLEGIFLLGRGRSFRTTQLSNVVRDGARCIEVTGWRAGPGGCVAGIRRCLDKTELRIDGQTVGKISSLARVFPVQLVNPRSHELLERGPDVRRRFVDWGVFHVEHDYVGLAARYQRVLRQRNEALKSTPEAVAYVWDHQLAALGEQVEAARASYLESLADVYQTVAAAIGAPQAITFALSRGWAKGVSLEEALRSKRGGDRKQGYTSVGPHRADMEVRLGDVAAETRLSRGQQKSLVLALVLAQTELVSRATSRKPILLLDDLAAELDDAARGRVVRYLRTMGAQSFITCLDEQVLGPLREDRLFHVERGRLSV